MEAEVKTVDITPTWEAVLAILLAVIENPNARPSAKASARGELRRMAQLADRYVAIHGDVRRIA